MDAIKCGNFIQTRRKELNMTQAELANKLNLTDKAISRWERGLGLPDINSLEDLALALDVSIYELIKSERMDETKEEIDDSIKEVVSLACDQKDTYKKKQINIIIICLIVSTIIISTIWGMMTSFVWNWAILGLCAYIIAIINLLRVIFISNKYSGLMILTSMSLASFTLMSEYIMVRDWVVKKEWVSLEDVVPLMPEMLLKALIIGIVINLVAAIISEVKYKK